MSSGSLGTGGMADEFVPARTLPVRGRRGLLAGMTGTADGWGGGSEGVLMTLILCELLGGGGGSIVSPGDFRSGRGELLGARGDNGASAARFETCSGSPLMRGLDGEPGVTVVGVVGTGLNVSGSAAGNGGTSASIGASGTTVVVDP